MYLIQIKSKVEEKVLRTSPSPRAHRTTTNLLTSNKVENCSHC